MQHSVDIMRHTDCIAFRLICQRQQAMAIAVKKVSGDLF